MARFEIADSDWKSMSKIGLSSRQPSSTAILRDNDNHKGKSKSQRLLMANTKTLRILFLYFTLCSKEDQRECPAKFDLYGQF